MRPSLTDAVSRRGVVGTLGGGFLAAAQLAHLANASEAKGTGKRRKKRKNKNNRKHGKIVVRFDAICPGPTDNTGAALDEGSRYAQTFTALNTGRLAVVEVLVAAFLTDRPN